MSDDIGQLEYKYCPLLTAEAQQRKRDRMKKSLGEIGVGVTLLVSLVFGVGMVTNAAPSWTTIGVGWGANRAGGWEGSPSVQVTTTTRNNPSAVRYTIRNHASSPRSVDVWWHLDCFNPGQFGPERTISLSGNFSTVIAAKALYVGDPGSPAGSRNCSVDVWVDYNFDSFGDNGRLTLKIDELK